MQLYKLDFPNGKSYIGITSKTAQERFKEHCQQSKRTNPAQNAIHKYGKENITINVLANVDNWELLCLAEQEAIEKYNTKSPNGYNLTDGGEGLSGHVFSEAHKAGISKALKGRVFSSESLKRMSESAKKKIITPEHRRKLIESQKGDKNPLRGRTLSSDIKAKISKSLTGLKASPETKLKQSIAHSSITDETRKKLSNASRSRPPKSACGFKGVSKTKEGNRWRARCVIMGKEKIIGNFNTPEEASEAYQKFVANL